MGGGSTGACDSVGGADRAAELIVDKTALNGYNKEAMAKEITITFKAEAPALKLWTEWFIWDGSPVYASECDGDHICFFCHQHLLHEDDDSEHAEGCIYMRAKQLVANSPFGEYCANREVTNNSVS